MSHIDSNVPPGYILVPRWAMLTGFAIFIAMLILALFTFPLSPIVQVAANQESSTSALPAARLAPRTVTSTSRTLGDPNALIQLVEFGDFQ